MTAPINPTPSALRPVLQNAEHHEAAQEATNRERHAYVKTLPADEQARFAAVEQAVALLEGAKVPFMMWTFPEGIKDGRAMTWYYGKETYFEPYTKGAMEEGAIHFHATRHAFMQAYTRALPITIALYDRVTKECFSVYGAPEPDKESL